MTDYLLTAAYALLFIFLIYRWKLFSVPEIPRMFYAVLFVVKIFSGVALAQLFIKYFNGGDTYSYFKDACKLHNLIYTHPSDFIFIMTGRASEELPLKHGLGMWSSYGIFDFDAQTIIRLNTLIRFVSFGSYYVHIAFFAFLSLTGLQLFYRSLRRAVWANYKLFFAFLFLFPSLLFWTSGILKEGLLLFGMGLLLFGTGGLLRLHKQRLKFVSLTIGGLFIMLLVKTYVLVLLIPGLISWYWVAKTKNRFIGPKFLSVHIIYYLLLFNIHLFIPSLHAAEILYSKQHHSIVFAEYMNSRSIIHPPLIEPNVWSIITHSPASFIQTLRYPSMTHAHNPFSLAASIENILLLLCMVLTILFSSKPPKQSVPLVWLSLFFIAGLYILIGLTTTTAGSLVRYKVPALPFLFFLICMVINKNKIRGVWFRITGRSAKGE